MVTVHCTCLHVHVHVHVHVLTTGTCTKTNVNIQNNHVHVHACVLVLVVLIRNSTLCLPTSLVFSYIQFCMIHLYMQTTAFVLLHVHVPCNSYSQMFLIVVMTINLL